MARIGRGFPAMASPFVAGQLQVPLVGIGHLVLPTPLRMVGTANQGIQASGAMVLPRPLLMQGSGGVGAGVTAFGRFTLPTPILLSGQAQAGAPVTVPTQLYSATDLLARCLFYAQRPAIDESMSTAQWLSLLTEAHSYWVAMIASVAPSALYGPPTLLQTQDGGISYQFGTDIDGNPIFPIGHVELRESPFGREWVAAAEWDNSGDFVMAGDSIIFPGQRAKTFGNGPWGRWVTPGGTISLDGQHEPTIKPVSARMLMVFHAVTLWASRGGFRDPGPWQAKEDALWYGNPQQGNVGLQGMYKTQYLTQGGEAIGGSSGRWWGGLNTGAGYSR